MLILKTFSLSEEKPGMAVSIHDVAKRAGVSIATVSRVLNHPEAVVDRKLAAVKEAIAHYHYQPNQFGRGLVKQDSKMVGAYFPHSEESVFDSRYNIEILKGLDKAAEHYGYTLLIIHEREQFERGAGTGPRFMEYVTQKKIDGLVILAITPLIQDGIIKLIDDEFPLVHIGGKIHPRGHNVYGRLESYQYQMLETMYRRGHRRVLMFVLKFHQPVFQRVLEKAAARMPDMTVCGEPYVQGPENEEREYLLAKLRRHVLDGACTAAGYPGMDHMGVFLGVCQQLGITIPEGLSVIAVEHIKGEGEAFFPALDAMYVPARDMGTAAAEMLIQGLINAPSLETPQDSREFEAVYHKRESLIEKA
jgi:DNA-binding LacI/PurR family transcriptional regulator